MKVLLLALTMMCTAQAFAKTHKLLKIHNGVTNEYIDMTLQENDIGDITSLQQIYLNGKTATKRYELKNIKTGVVLLEKKGRNIVTLVGTNLDSSRGGDITIGFLVNAVTKKKKAKEFKIAQESNGKWKMYFRGQAVSKLKFVGNKIAFVGLVGVKKIVINYENSKNSYTEKFVDDTLD